MGVPQGTPHAPGLPRGYRVLRRCYESWRAGLARTRREQEKKHRGRAMGEIGGIERGRSETLMLKTKWRERRCTWIGRPLLVGFGEVSVKVPECDKPLGPQSGLVAAEPERALQQLQKTATVAATARISRFNSVHRPPDSN